MLSSSGRRARLLGFLRDSVAASPGPWPWSKMVRTGLSIALGFGLFAAMGNLAAAILCAVFTSLLIFMDQAGPVRERVAVLVAGALAVAAAAALGAAISGSQPAVLAGVLALAVAAGLIHSSVPGVDMIPRQALIGFLVGAYLPQVDAGAWPSAVVGAACALGGAVLDSLLRRSVVGPSLSEVRGGVRFPGLRFGLCYGASAAAGLVLASELGATRPFWVTITTAVVMQPDSRASVQRALQRFAGTMAGVLVAFLVARVSANSGGVGINSGGVGILGAGVLILPFVWPLGFARNHAFGVALLTAWILFLLDLAQPAEGALELFLARLSDTALGCAFAVLGTTAASSREARAPASL